MAETFGADPIAAGETSRELVTIRATMNGLGNVFGGTGGATGSGRIEKALNTFYKDSSDSRKAADGLLERAAGLLDALARGSGELDAALGQAVSGNGSAGPTAPAAPAPAAPAATR